MASEIAFAGREALRHPGYIRALAAYVADMSPEAFNRFLVKQGSKPKPEEPYKGMRMGVRPSNPVLVFTVYLNGINPLPAVRAGLLERGFNGNDFFADIRDEEVTVEVYPLS